MKKKRSCGERIPMGEGDDDEDGEIRLRTRGLPRSTTSTTTAYGNMTNSAS